MIRKKTDVSIAVGLKPQILELAKSKQISHSSMENFWELVEEISHFTYLTFCLRIQKPISLLDMEMQGEIDKYVLTQDLFDTDHTLYTKLFHQYSLRSHLNPEEKQRYHTANRLGAKFIRSLTQKKYGRFFWSEGLLRRFRDFYRRASFEKCRWVESKLSFYSRKEMEKIFAQSMRSCR
ncbi:MAG: hypothetical protein KDD52_00100 [Bdellovibrionales bacterium]|nr:hypothetical protein [Bdellovibrionales bacterium]